MDELVAPIRGEWRVEEGLAPMTPLLSSGLVDSLSVVVLLSAIEEHHGVVIDEAKVGVETFDTPEQILEHVTSLSVRD